MPGEAGALKPAVPGEGKAAPKAKEAPKPEGKAEAPAAGAAEAPALVPATPKPVGTGEPLSQQQVAEQMQAARGITDEAAYAQRMQDLEKNYGEQMGKITSEGAVNPLLSWGAPLALGAGGGYLLGDQQGAATGAGLALGARFGAGPALKRIAESRGIQKALGKEMPSLGTAFGELPKEEMTKALMMGGGLGVGGGIAGHYLGKPKPKEPWYSSLMGLAPLAASAALPYMAMRGAGPGVMQQLQGLTPADPYGNQGMMQ